MLSLEIPLNVRSWLNRRGHWRKLHQEKKAERMATRWAWLASGHKTPEFPVVVQFTRRSPRMLDEGDNLPSAFKYIRDELCEIWGVNDKGGPNDPVQFEYAQEKSSLKDITIQVTSI